MIEKIICCGFGGQGIMIMGKFLSHLAMQAGKFTTYLPAYGAEVRGGAAYCMVTISDSQIYSPFIEKADTVIAMNGPSLAKFEKRIKKGGLLLLNQSLASTKFKRKDLQIKNIAFTQIAEGLGNIKCANTVALGAYLANKKIGSAKQISVVLGEMLAGLSKGIFKVNQAAIKKGMACGKG